jgi:hypothetical protein
VYSTEVVGSVYPFQRRRSRVEQVYIDRDHLHLYPCTTPEAQRSLTRDLTGP